jgi:hypothetical protein
MRIAPSVTASAGEENFFLFGLTAEQVEGSRGWYNPRWHYENEPETRAALDLIASNHFSRNDPASSRPSSMHCCNTATTTGIWPTSPVTLRPINGWGNCMPTKWRGHAR